MTCSRLKSLQELELGDDGSMLSALVLIDGEPAAVLARAVRRELHENYPALVRARRTWAERAPWVAWDQRLHRLGCDAQRSGRRRGCA